VAQLVPNLGRRKSKGERRRKQVGSRIFTSGSNYFLKVLCPHGSVIKLSILYSTEMRLTKDIQERLINNAYLTTSNSNMLMNNQSTKIVSVGAKLVYWTRETISFQGEFRMPLIMDSVKVGQNQ
jgi:hypothetical protein